MDSRLIFRPFVLFSFKETEICNLSRLSDSCPFSEGKPNGARGSPVRGVNLDEQPSKKIFKEIKSNTEPYQKPTQVGGRKCAKANEWFLVKELGNQVVVTSG